MIKKIILSYSIFLLFLGNILFSNIHHFYNHNHNHSIEYHECEECINVENNNSYIQVSTDSNFLNRDVSQIPFPNFFVIKFDPQHIFSSRAPPIS